MSAPFMGRFFFAHFYKIGKKKIKSGLTVVLVQ